MSTKALVTPQVDGHTLMVRLAREIAMDMHPLDKILEKNQITSLDFRRIEKHPQFLKLLSSEIVAWNSASNTSERVKLKTSAMIEEWLPEAFLRMHDDSTPLMQRTDLAKLISSLAGMGKTDVNAGGVGERFSVTINLGADAKLSFNKEQLPSQVTKVIEGERVD